MTARKAAAGARTANRTPVDFAEATSLSESTVRNMIARGELRAVHLGRAVRIPISEFERLGLDVPKFVEVVA